MTPAGYDALCRQIELKLREQGLFDDLDSASRRSALRDAAQRTYPWEAQRIGQVQITFDSQIFSARVLLAETPGSDAVREAPPLSEVARRELGNLQGDLQALREALLALPDWVEGFLPGFVHVDAGDYEVIIERFNFKQFRADFASVPTGTVTERARKWN